MEHDFDVFAVTETWLSTDSLAHLVSPSLQKLTDVESLIFHWESFPTTENRTQNSPIEKGKFRE